MLSLPLLNPTENDSKVITKGHKATKEKRTREKHHQETSPTQMEKPDQLCRLEGVCGSDGPSEATSSTPQSHVPLKKSWPWGKSRGAVKYV